MKNILLPTDFSENSANAIRYALEFFRGNEITFFVVNVQKISEFATDDLMVASPGTSVYEAIVADNKEKLHNFMNPVISEYASEAYTFNLKVDFDVFNDAIRQAIDKYEIDLLIMGSNGATGAAEVLFGSNTLQVIRQIDAPLLIIPKGFKYGGLEQILFTLHLNEDMNIERIQTLIEVANLHKAKVNVLEVAETFEDLIDNTREKAEAILKHVPHRFQIIKGIPTPISVNAFVQLFPVDLHAMFVERESFLKRFIFGSETHKISYGTKVPLLVMHHPNS